MRERRAPGGARRSTHARGDVPRAAHSDVDAVWLVV